MSHPRATALDGLRGHAAVAVVFYHAVLGADAGLIPDVLHRGVQDQGTAYGALLKLFLSVFSGEVAVAVFFVISGFVLFRALDAMQGPAARVPAIAWRFLLRRLFRIWPTMAVCVVAMFAVWRGFGAVWPGRLAEFSAGDLVENLVLTRITVHGATWTLAVELMAAPVLVVVHVAVRRFGRGAILPFLGYAWLAAMKYNELLLHSGILIGGLPFILGGVAVACGWGGAIMRSRRAGAVAAVLAAALLADLLFVPATMPRLHDNLLYLAIPLLVAYVLHGGAGKLLRGRVSQHLGRISYSLYLWNVPVFELILHGVLPGLAPGLARAHPLETGIAVALVALGITLPVARLSERWLERPSNRLGHRLTAAPAGVPATGLRPTPARG